jgi:DNA-binding MarR family transcriptional regulator
MFWHTIEDHLVPDLAKGLSKNQKRILEMLEIQPEMTAREIAEMLFGKIVKYKSKEYSSVYRSLKSLEKKSYIQRVHIQLRWRKKDRMMKSSAQNLD